MYDYRVQSLSAGLSSPASGPTLSWQADTEEPQTKESPQTAWQLESLDMLELFRKSNITQMMQQFLTANDTGKKTNDTEKPASGTETTIIAEVSTEPHQKTQKPTSNLESNDTQNEDLSSGKNKFTTNDSKTSGSGVIFSLPLSFTAYIVEVMAVNIPFLVIVCFI